MENRKEEFLKLLENDEVLDVSFLAGNPEQYPKGFVRLEDYQVLAISWVLDNFEPSTSIKYQKDHCPICGGCLCEDKVEDDFGSCDYDHKLDCPKHIDNAPCL
jgi:hypothetical protein